MDRVNTIKLPIFSGRDQTKEAFSVSTDSKTTASILDLPRVSSELLQHYKGVRFSGSKEILQGLKTTEKQRFVDSREVLSFDEYLDDVFKAPHKYLRNSSQYTVDAIEYFNRKALPTEVDDSDHETEKKKSEYHYLGAQGLAEKIEILGQKVISFDFTSKPWLPKSLADKTGVEGQELPIYKMYKILKKNAQKAHPTRMIVLHGPNATGKTHLIETLFEALEQYSKVSEGAVYRFNWVFKKDLLDDMGLDFGYEMPVTADESQHPASDDDSHCDTNDVSVIIPTNLNTNPIFLLPEKQRIQVINDLEKEGKVDHTFNQDFIIKGRLDSSSKKIYNALMRYYDGDTSKVLKHVQVERLTLSQQSRQGLVIVPEAQTRDAQIEAITSDIEWNKLPDGIAEAFRTAGLVRLHGPLADANRGHLMYDDKWKGQASLDMLRVAEKSKLNLANVEEFLDLTIWATTNDSDIDMLDKQFPNWGSLKERVSFIPVGYVRQYQSSANIYRDRLNALFPKESNRVVGPHVLEAFGLWTTMTYLMPPEATSFKEMHPDDKPVLVTAIEKLKKEILHKALLYQGQPLDLYALRSAEVVFKPEEEKVLKRYLKNIADEYNMGVGRHKFMFYEGGSGISPREAWDVLEEAATRNRKEDFTLLELFDELEAHIEHRIEYADERKKYATAASDALQQAKEQGKTIEFNIPTSYQSPQEALKQVKHFMQMRVRHDVQDALNILKPQTEHLNTFRKYLAHVKASTQKTAVQKEYREPSIREDANELLMTQVEKLIKLDSKTELKAFREKLIRDLGSWATKNPGENPMSDENLTIIFDDYLERMVQKDVNNTREKLDHFISDAEKYFEYKHQNRTLKEHEINRDRLNRLHKTLSNLKESNKGYTDKTLPKMLDLAFTRDEDYMKWLKQGASTEDSDSKAPVNLNSKQKGRIVLP